MAGTGTELSVRLLGGFEVRAGNHVLLDGEWRRRKAQSIIKLVALQPSRRLHREQALQAVWPGFSPRSATNNLSQNLHYIRSTLKAVGARAPLIIASGNMLTIAPEVSLDVDELRELAKRARNGRSNVDAYRRALAAWRELLPADLYEPWTEQVRRELSRLRRDLLVDFSALPLTDEDRASTIRSLEFVVDADPVDEGAQCALMRLLSEAGDRPAAVRQYTQLAEVLQREMKVAPSKDTNDTYRAIIAKKEVDDDAGPGDTTPPVPGRSMTAPTTAMEVVSIPEDVRSSAIDVALVARVSHTISSAVAACEEHRWPAFVTNEFAELIGANTAFQRLVGVELSGTSLIDRNLLSVASDPRFADRLVNWDEAIGTMISVFKSADSTRENGEQPATYLAAVLERFFAGDPAYVNRLIRLWQAAPATWERKEHWSYPIRWRASNRTMMRFEAIVTSASFVERLTINDWIPADAETWRELDRMAGSQHEPEGESVVEPHFQRVDIRLRQLA